MIEPEDVIKKLKRNKSPGPDEIPMEIFKEMNTEALEELRKILNIWWNEENMSDERYHLSSSKHVH